MQEVKIEKILLRTLHIDGVIRLKDYCNFFDSRQSRLKALVNVIGNCKVNISFIGLEPEIIVTLSPQHSDWLSPVGKRLSYEHFYVEMERIRTIIGTLVLLIDSKAMVCIDFLEVEELAGRRVYEYTDFIREKSCINDNAELSDVIPKQLDEKIDSLMNLIFPPQDYILGACHQIWRVKKNIFRYGFNLDWKTPSEKHPDILFD